MKIVTKPIEPFVIKEEGTLTGFSIEFMEKLVAEISKSENIKLKAEFYEVETVREVISEVEERKADAACAAISMTPEREESVNFTYPIFESGFQIMISKHSEMKVGDVLWTILPRFFF